MLKHREYKGKVVRKIKYSCLKNLSVFVLFPTFVAAISHIAVILPVFQKSTFTT